MIWALHGNLGASCDWDATEHALGEDLEKVDLWKRPVAPFSSWANQLNDIASALDPEPILLGYSLGGRLAMHVLTGADPVWKGAIFVSAHPGLRAGTTRRERLKRDADWATLLRQAKPREFLDAWNAQPIFNGDLAPDSQKLMVDTCRESIAQAFEEWSLGRQEDLRGELAKCDVPQLWIVGEDDAKFRKIAEEAVSEIPTASLHVIRGCGHRVLLQKPAELAECVRNFKAEVIKNHVDESRRV